MILPENPFHFLTSTDWRAWLQENHTRESEAWLLIVKKGSSRPGIRLAEAVEEALCFGWIDGVMHSSDEDTYILRFSPRQRGSVWAVSNQKRVEKLIEQGRMTEAGLERVRQAQEDGTWQAAIQREEPSCLPDDLQNALSQDPRLQEFWERLPPSHKKQYLFWIEEARTEQTRRKRIQKMVGKVGNVKR